LARSQGLPIPSFPKITDFHPRQLLMTALTVLWATRLGTDTEKHEADIGSFLFYRVVKSGGDSRFDKLKKKVYLTSVDETNYQPKRFFWFWVGQATWVSLVALPVFAVNAIPARLHPALNWKDYLGAGVWITGFLTEVIADRQKTQWRQEKNEGKHSEDWISRGLWGWSRHPNYFGPSPKRHFPLLTIRGECDLGWDVSDVGACSECHIFVSSWIWICHDSVTAVHKCGVDQGTYTPFLD
jgi:steroid 5-alpha reductase family enzyme